MLFLFVLLGFTLGSFGNVLLSRLPKGKSLRGCSRCPACRSVLAARDLIPLFSYIALCGRCRRCRARIPPRYPLIELGSAALFVLSLKQSNGEILPGILLAVSLWLLLLVAVMDIETGHIADALNMPFVLVSALFALAFETLNIKAVSLAGGFFLMQWLLSRGQWVGSGDIILALGISALLGSWQKVLLWLVIAYISGAVAAMVLLLSKKKNLKSRIVFGPFLMGSAVTVLLWGEQILEFCFNKVPK